MKKQIQNPMEQSQLRDSIPSNEQPIKICPECHGRSAGIKNYGCEVCKDTGEVVIPDRKTE